MRKNDIYLCGDVEHKIVSIGYKYTKCTIGKTSQIWTIPTEDFARFVKNGTLVLKK